MGACIITPCVKTSEDKFVPSKLFNDLRDNTSTRKEAVSIYSAATNEEFVDSARGIAEFENGEITFESLLELVPDIKELEDSKLINIANKRINSGTYTFQEALTKLQEFNNKSPLRKELLATIIPDGNKYKLTVVKRTASNVDKLNDTVKNQVIQNKIIDRLKELNVAVDFLEKENKLGSRYSTFNAEQTADGLYHLIKIASGEKNVTEEVAEEAGHFAVASLGDNILVQRLEEALSTESARKEVLGDEYESKALGPNPKREVAGVLVGRALIDKLENKSIISRLANRVANLARYIYAKVSGDEVKQEIILAKNYADKIAAGFISDNFEGDVKTALARKETLLSSNIGSPNVIFKNMVGLLNRQLSAIRAKGPSSLGKSLEEKLEKLVSGRIQHVNSNTVFAEAICMDGLLNGVANIIDFLGQTGDVNAILSSIDVTNSDDFFSKMAENGYKLRQVAIFLENARAISRLISANTGIATMLTTGQVAQLKNLNATLNQKLSEVDQILIGKQRKYFIDFCENFYGNKFISHTARLLFQSEKKGVLRGAYKLRAVGSTDLSFMESLTSLSEDINLYERYLCSMSNNPDIIGQIADVCVKQANDYANKETNDVWDELRVLDKRWHKLKVYDRNGKKISLGKTQRFLFETIEDKDGKEVFTGNIKSVLLWGKWEKEREDFISKCKQDFIDKYTDPVTKVCRLDSMSEMIKAIEWDTYFRPLMKDWNKRNSIWDDTRKIWMPSNGTGNKMDYTNYEFRDLLSDPKNKEFKEWYDDYLNLKGKLDDHLPEGVTLPYRLPQFRGTFTDRIKNNRSITNPIKATSYSMRSSLLNTFCEGSEDYDFGSMSTYNAIEEDLFGSKYTFEGEKPRRLPMFGINKLKNINDLSTDLMHSTLSYAAMTNTYGAMSRVVDVLEVGKDTMLSRSVGGVSQEADKIERSRVYARYGKYLDKQVYGIAIPKSGRRWFITNKKYKMINSIIDKHNKGEALNRSERKLLKQINKGVYDLDVLKDKQAEYSRRSVIPEKVASFFSGLGAKMFLGFNIPGGMVNTGTGVIETFKEAASAEHISMKDWISANKMYFDSFIPNWMDFGKQAKDNKISLFSRYFDARNENWNNYRDFYSTHTGLFNMFQQIPFLAYKAGDHYMQLIPYLALAKHTKLYRRLPNDTLKKINLYDAYQKVDNGDATYHLIESIIEKQEKGIAFDNNELEYLNKLNNGFYDEKILRKEQMKHKKGSTLKLMEEPLFKNRDDVAKYDLVEVIINKINNSSNMLSLHGTLTQEERDFILNNSVRLTSKEDAINKLNNIKNTFIWNSSDEDEFHNKAREMNDRMHGIYNKIDAVAFSQNWFNNMLLSMRGWVLGMVQRRFATDHFSLVLGKDVEGSVLSAIKAFVYGFNGGYGKGTVRNFFWTLTALLLPYPKSVKNKLMRAGMSEHQVSNLRRNNMDMLFILGLFLIKLATAGGGDGDDDDDDDPTTGFIHYMSGRLAMEQDALVTPWGMNRERSNILDLMPAGFNAAIELGNIAYEMAGAAVTDEDNSSFYYQQSKEGKYEKHDPKYLYHLIRYSPMRSVYTFEHGHEAFKNFEFGMRSKK